MSLIASVIGGAEFWAEAPECVGYADQSASMDQIIVKARRFRHLINRHPLADVIVSHRLLRLAGLVSNAEYPTFKDRPEQESSDGRMADLRDEDRRIVAILPAVSAHAIYSMNGLVHCAPLSVWALVREADGSYKVAGMDGEHFICDEWSNFGGYDSELPQAGEFKLGD